MEAKSERVLEWIPKRHGKCSLAESAWEVGEVWMQNVAGLSKGLQKLEPYFKGFYCIVWTDHANNTFFEVLKGNRRINRKVTNLALEIHDIPHQKMSASA